MELLNYAQRCKNKFGFDVHTKVHAADNNQTFCGKDLNEMWFINSSRGMTLNNVTCKKCLSVARNVSV